MKTIPLRTFPELTSADVFRGVLENTPGNGGEMRKRFRVIDAIEAAEKDGATEVLLEDADYSDASRSDRGVSIHQDHARSSDRRRRRRQRGCSSRAAQRSVGVQKMLGFRALGEEALGEISESLIAVTGVSSTATAGILTPSVATSLVGVSATASVGTLIPGPAVTLAGVALTASAGTLASSLSKGLTGVSSTASAGTSAGAESGALTGVSASASAGSLLPSVAITAFGVSSTATAGALSPSVSVTLSGAASTASAGTISRRCHAAGGSVIHGLRWCHDAIRGRHAGGRIGHRDGRGSPRIKVGRARRCLGYRAGREYLPDLTAGGVTGVSSAVQVGAGFPMVATGLTGVSSAAQVDTMALSGGTNLTGVMATIAAGTIFVDLVSRQSGTSLRTPQKEIPHSAAARPCCAALRAATATSATPANGVD